MSVNGPAEWQERIARIANTHGGHPRIEVPRRNGKTRREWPAEEHTMAGCRRRHVLGKTCLLGCSCACHAEWDDLGPPCRTAAQLEAAILRGNELAAEELASMPADDGTVSVSTLDSRTYVREGFKLCRACGWRRGPGGRCTCAAPPAPRPGTPPG